jgi:SAM-dependent methyltransferase
VRTAPVRRDAFSRGTPVDRYYIERFLRRWNDPLSEGSDIRGSVLEFQDKRYAALIGHCDEVRSPVAHVDVLDLGDNPRANLRADIADAPHLPDAAYDTVICTQVLHYVFDVAAAVATLARFLRVGGVLYVTVPGISPYFNVGVAGETEYWRFTPDSLRRILHPHFRSNDVVVEAYGNVLASVAFLHGLAAEEFTSTELDRPDASFPVVIVARAVRTS